MPGTNTTLSQEQIKNLYEPNLRLSRALYTQNKITLNDVDRHFYQFSQKDTYLIFEDRKDPNNYFTYQARLRGNYEYHKNLCRKFTNITNRLNQMPFTFRETTQKDRDWETVIRVFAVFEY